MKHMIPYKKRTWLIIFDMIINLIIFGVPLTLNMVMNGEIPFSESVLLGIVGIMFLEILLQLLFVKMQQKQIKEYKVKLSLELYQKIYEMNYQGLSRYGATYLVERADTTVSTYANFHMRAIPTIGAKLLIILMVLGYALKVNVGLFFISIGIVVANIVGFLVLNEKLLQKSIQMNQVIPKERKDIYQISDQIDFIKQNGDNSNLNRVLTAHLEKIENLTKNVNQFASEFNSLIDFFNMFAQNVVVLLLYYCYVNQKIQYSEVFTASIVLSYFLPAILQIVAVNIDLRDMKSAKEFLGILEEEHEASGNKQIEEIKNININMEKMYSGDGNVLLEDVQVQAKTGDIIGIIGESGMGKSTLVKSILKFWKENMSIEINDIPLEKIENESLRRKISFYSQNLPIISGDVLESLNFGREEVAVEEYCKIDFLQKFIGEDGKTRKVILENGSNLSGGDKQKIALARLFTEEADVIILDEPTSSLDEETEKMIFQKLSGQKKKIMFLITHKMENLQYCNKIYKVSDHRIFEVKGN